MGQVSMVECTQKNKMDDMKNIVLILAAFRGRLNYAGILYGEWILWTG